MKLLVLAEPGDQTDRLTAAIEEAAVGRARFVQDWSGLVREMSADRPDVMLLSYSVLSRRGATALRAADVTLAALRIPAVIVLTAEEAALRPEIETATRFEFFLVPPWDAGRIAHHLHLTMNLTGDHQAAPGSVTGPEPTVPDDAGFRRERTPKATPAQGVDISWMRDTEAGTTSESPTAPHDAVPAHMVRDLPDEESTSPGLATAVEIPPDDAPGTVPAAPDDASVAEGTAPGIARMTEAGEADAPAPEGTSPGVSRSVQAMDASASGAMSRMAATSVEQERHWTERDSGVDDRGRPRSVESGTMDEPIALGSESGSVPRAHSSSHRGAAVPLGVRGGEGAQDVHEAFGPETPSHTPPAQSASSEHSAIWTGSSASIQLPRPDPNLPHLVIDMPDPNGGSLSAVPVPQVLLVLQMARATGELTLSTQALTRRFAFYEGEPGTVFQPSTAIDERNLLSTFVWADGEYVFEGKDVPSAQFHFMGDAPELVFRGIEGYLGVNETAMALGAFLKKYPVQTDNVRRYRRVVGLERLPSFLRTATGAATLEQLISGESADTEQTLRLAYFALISGCVIFADAPLDGPVPVDFRIPPVRRSAAPLRSTGPLPSGSPSRTVDVRTAPQPAAERQSSPPSAASSPTPRAATPQRTQEQAAESADTLQVLREQWEEIAHANPYDVFELDPGCGPDAVDARFYELVRRYHPDRFARAQSPEVQSLAEKLFLHVRNLHVELSNRERADGPISSDAFRGADADTGVQRRRRRAAARTGVSPRLSTTPGGVPRAEGGIGESSGSQARVSAGERIADKLRSLGGSATDPLAHSGAGAAYSGSHAANRSSALRNMSADQALRNARSATEQGNYGKALELLQLARARGGTGVVLEAYSTFLAYTQDYTSAHDALEALEEAASEVTDAFDKAAILTLAGHLQRREGANKESEILYKRALKEEPDNESAARWLRHLKRRTGDDDKKKPFSSTFLNKLFTKPK